MQAIEVLQAGPVMPVIVVHDAGQAVDLAAALIAGGIRVLELTLRTPAALDAMRRIRDALPDAIVGAGTVLDASQWQQAIDHGAQFGVSPGLTPALAQAVRKSGLPFVPGVSSASDLMRARDDGMDVLKLFPAEAVGGVALLKSLYGPFPGVRFCPTGGIGPNNAASYLSLPNVACVGGSWLVPDDAVRTHDWARITALASQTHALVAR